MVRVVIGGGMSGLVCAIASAKCGHSVILLEQNSRVGKKLSATGNGKCNLYNVAPQGCYNDNQFVQGLLARYSVDDVKQFFNSIGIFTYADSIGRAYPITDNANSVVDCLRSVASKLGVAIFNQTALAVRPNKDGTYAVTTNVHTHLCNEVVLACGSGSQANLPSLSQIVPQSYFTSTSPSLVPIKISNMPKMVNGLRLKTTVKLLQDGQAVCSRDGEVQFKDYGLSGICIMDLSAHIARNHVAGRNHTYQIEMDLCPRLSEAQLIDELTNRILQGVPTSQLFYGILHNKVAELVMSFGKTEVANIVKLIKNCTFTVDRLLGYEMSQVTAGGIKTDLLSSNMQLPNGVYAVGEVLNVDGNCGGYNLLFATISALCTLPQTNKETILSK
ncbi:MAG: aminoacetone oxidase family FAD-binding enzyme [Clostridia bacterium]|nr:aminoacetone oxidase family FAD-binding enzyme [Clostridia bacterium]